MQEQVAVTHHGADCHPAVFCALLNAVEAYVKLLRHLMLLLLIQCSCIQ